MPREPLDPRFDLGAWALVLSAFGAMSTVLALGVVPSPLDALAVPAAPVVILWWFASSSSLPGWLVGSAALAVLGPPIYLAFPSRAARSLAVASAWAWALCTLATCAAIV